MCVSPDSMINKRTFIHHTMPKCDSCNNAICQGVLKRNADIWCDNIRSGNFTCQVCGETDPQCLALFHKTTGKRIGLFPPYHYRFMRTQVVKCGDCVEGGMSSEQMRERFHKLSGGCQAFVEGEPEGNICTRCNKKKNLPRRTLCAQCFLFHGGRGYDARIDILWRQYGRCVQCSKGRPAQGNEKCDKCLQIQK